MNRRSLFKGFVACVAASAIEVCGWRVPKISGFDKAFKVGGDVGYFRLVFFEAYDQLPCDSPYIIKYKRNGADVTQDYLDGVYKKLLHDGAQ